jgi:hypothetical protein
MPQRYGIHCSHSLPGLQGLKIYFLYKLSLDFLLQLVARNTLTAARFLQTLPISTCAIVLNQLSKTLWLHLAGNKFLNKRNIDTYTVGDSTRPNLVRVKLSHNMDLLLS